MAGEELVDVSYRGIEVGSRLKLTEVGTQTAYVEISKPMPVGATLEITTDGGPALTGLVLRVREQVAGAEKAAGMRISVGQLEGDAKAWWDERVSVRDPVIPAPPGMPAQEEPAPVETPAPAAAAPAEEAAAPVPAEPAAEEEAPAPEAPEAAPEAPMAEAATTPGKTGSRRTMIMSTDEIRAAIEAGGQEAQMSDGVPASVDAESTDRTTTSQPDALAEDEEEPDEAGDSDAQEKDKKRKKRRRKKRKR
jgi:hypothetical protein